MVMGKFFDRRNTFVTGATGFVGANLTARLVAEGANVICLQRDEVHPNSLDLLDLRSKVTLVSGSVEDGALMERILNEYEVSTVFHLAAQALVGAANRSPLSTFESNIRGTYMLLEACRVNGRVQSVVVASSDKAYGSHAVLPYYEDFRLNAAYPYDVSKACADIISASFARTFDMPVSITRSANIYGPADMNLSRIIPGTIVSILKGERPIIRSDGTPVRDFVHTEDIATGYLLLAEKAADVAGEAFNFGSGEPISALDLVVRILELMDSDLEPDVLLKTKIDNEIDAQYLAADKVRGLGWEPTVDLDSGLRRTIEWYRDKWSVLTAGS